MSPRSSCSRVRQNAGMSSTRVLANAATASPLQANARICHYTLLLAVSVLVFLVNLGGPALWDVDEGRNSASTLEMMASGNLIVPYFNGEIRDHKPILLYWLQAAAISLCGVNEFAVRLPSALAALATVLLTYELGRRLFNKTTGLLGGLVVATSVMLGAAARFANPDALLNMATVLTFALFWWGYSRTGRVPFALCGVGCGLAVLAKGPVGLVLPASVVVLFLLWERRGRALFDRRLLLGCLTFTLVGLPWYILVAVETHLRFLTGFFLKHNVERFLGSMESHDFGIYFYPVVLLLGFAPWSAFLGPTMWYGLWSAVRSPWSRCRSWWEAARDGDEKIQSGDESPHSKIQNPKSKIQNAAGYRLLWCWLLVYLVFFSLAATKLPNYILPVSTPLAIMTARLLDRWRRGELTSGRWAFGLGLICFGLVGVSATVGLVIASGTVIIPGVRFPAITGLAWWAMLGVVPIVGAFLAARLWHARPAAGLTCLALSAGLFVGPLLAWAGEALDAFKPSRTLVAESHSLQPQQDIRIFNYGADHLASLHFYTQRGIDYCTCDWQALESLRTRAPVYLFISSADWERLRPRVTTPYRILATHKDLHRNVREVTVVTNDWRP